MAAYREVVCRLSERDVNLFVSPAGYLFASCWDELQSITEELEAEAVRRGIAVIVGIDLSPRALTQEYSTGARLSAFAFSWSPESGRSIWVQRSSSSENHYLATGESCSEERVLTVQGRRVAIVVCGEIFNDRIRNAVLQQHVDAAVDFGHYSQGFRVWAGMKVLTRAGLPVCFCSVHAGPWTKKYCYTVGGTSATTWRSDFIVEGSPRLEVKFWNVAMP